MAEKRKSLYNRNQLSIEWRRNPSGLGTQMHRVQYILKKKN